MSHAMLPKQAVIDACEAYLAQRTARIEKRREKLIQQKMTGFLRHKTRESAIDSLNRECAFSEWNSLCMWGAIPAYAVENLLKLATMVSDHVMVDEDAARLIAEHYKENDNAEAL